MSLSIISYVFVCLGNNFVLFLFVCFFGFIYVFMKYFLVHAVIVLVMIWIFSLVLCCLVLVFITCFSFGNCSQISFVKTKVWISTFPSPIYIHLLSIIFQKPFFSNYPKYFSSKSFKPKTLNEKTNSNSYPLLSLHLSI